MLHRMQEVSSSIIKLYINVILQASNRSCGRSWENIKSSSNNIYQDLPVQSCCQNKHWEYTSANHRWFFRFGRHVYVISTLFSLVRFRQENTTDWSSGKILFWRQAAKRHFLELFLRIVEFHLDVINANKKLYYLTTWGWSRSRRAVAPPPSPSSPDLNVSWYIMWTWHIL